MKTSFLTFDPKICISTTPLHSFPLFLQGYKPLGRSLCTSRWEEVMPVQSLMLCVQPQGTMSIALYSPAEMCLQVPGYYFSNWFHWNLRVIMFGFFQSLCVVIPGKESCIFKVYINFLFIWYLLQIDFFSIKLLEFAHENFHGNQKKRDASPEERIKVKITPLLI